MQSFFVLRPMTCQTEIIFDMIDVPFNSSPDFVGVIPFLSAADDTGICTEILFGIDIYYPATRSSSG